MGFASSIFGGFDISRRAFLGEEGLCRNFKIFFLRRGSWILGFFREEDFFLALPFLDA